MTFHEARDDGAESDGRNLPSIKLIALLVVVVAIAIFFFQNGESVEVRFLGFDVEWPARIVIIVSVVAGVLIDRLGGFFWNRARRRKHERND